MPVRYLDEEPQTPKRPATSFEQRHGVDIEPANMPAQVAGLGQGLRDIWQGLGQAGMDVGSRLGLISGEVPERYTQDVMAQRQQFEEQYGGQPGVGAMRFIGANAPYLAVPGALGASTLGRVATGAGIGGLIGGTQFMEPGQSRGAAAATGAALGAALPAAGGLARAATRRSLRLKPGAAEVVEIGKREDVPVLGADIVAAPTMQRAGVAAESQTTGMGVAREQQMRAAERAARNLQERTGVVDDVAEDIHKSMWSRFDKVRAEDRANFQRLHAAVGGDKVRMDTVEDVANRIIAEELRKPEAHRSKAILDLMAKYQWPETEMDFMTAHAIRSDLSDDIASLMQAGNRKEARPLKRIKKAMNADMEAFARERGAGELWEQSKKYHAENVAPFDKADVRKSLYDPDTDEIYARFVNQGKQGKGQRFYNALDEQGRRAVRSGIVAEAIDKAFDADTGNFSPAKFSGYLDKKQKTTGIFFGSAEKARIDGLQKLMRHIVRAGQYMENPPTGQRALEPMNMVAALTGGGFGSMAGGAPGGVMGAAAAYGAMKAPAQTARILLGTERGREFLLAVNRLRPDSFTFTRFVASRLPAVLAAQSEEIQ